MKRTIFPALLATVLVLSSCGSRLKDGVHHFELLATGDIDGEWICGGDSTAKPSLLSVNWYVDSVRMAAGADNVMLLDGGDFLGGSAEAYYSNHVSKSSGHLYPEIASYMKYDAVVMGDKDFGTGSEIYDRVAGELKKKGIAVLAGNTFISSSGKAYLPTYKIFKKAGLKVAVLGYTNPLCDSLPGENLRDGIEFKSYVPLIQEDIDKLKENEAPDVVIVAVHSGSGSGDDDGSENQGIFLWNTLKGADFIVCAHDGKKFVIQDSTCLINPGRQCAYIASGSLDVTVSGGKITGKSISAKAIPVDCYTTDSAMEAEFMAEASEIESFISSTAGELTSVMRTRDAYRGMCGYMDLLHSAFLSRTSAQISIAAPLDYDQTFWPGILTFGDIFSMYPRDEEIELVQMSGKEVSDLLENGYDKWINKVGGSDASGAFFLDLLLWAFSDNDDSAPSDNILDIKYSYDSSLGESVWSFTNNPESFCSAAGVEYMVDASSTMGHRVRIFRMADGSSFDENASYTVAVPARFVNAKMKENILASYPNATGILYDYVSSNGAVPMDRTTLGTWNFAPQELAERMMDNDMGLLFGETGQDEY